MNSAQMARRKRRVEKERISYVSSFQDMKREELLRKMEEYKEIKKKAGEKGNKPLAHHSEDMLEVIEKELKRRGLK